MASYGLQNSSKLNTKPAQWVEDDENSQSASRIDEWLTDTNNKPFLSRGVQKL